MSQMATKEQIMAITAQLPKMLDVPLNVGTMPDWNIRLGNPQLKNMYYNNGHLYCSPGLVALAAIPNVRAMHYSAYQQGSYIVVTNTAVYTVSLGGAIDFISSIVYTGAAVKIDENLQNQVTIVDGGGSYAYVYDQRAKSFTKIGTAQGLNQRLITIVGVVVINTFTILISKEGWFQISNPNNALDYNEAYVNEMDPSLTSGVGVASLDNNLYILGTTGIERWEPGLTNNYAFPFTRDSNYRTDYGVASAGSIVRAIDEIYFLSSYYVPMVLNSGGARELIADSQFDEGGRSQKSAGIARIIGGYQDVTTCFGSFYSNRGNYFYHLTFLAEGISWVCNSKNKVWAYSDDLITAAPQKEIQEAVGSSNGLYQLSDTPIVGQEKHRLFIPERQLLYKGIYPNRSTLSGIEVRMVQGNLQTNSTGTYENPNYQYLQLSLSIDGLTYGNIIEAPIGQTGERQAVSTWNCNITCQEITPKLEYWGDLDLCIEKFFMYIR